MGMIGVVGARKMCPVLMVLVCGDILGVVG